MPAAKKAEPIIGTTQWMSVPLVQANQKRPIGRRTDPTKAGGSRASGGAMPLVWAATRLYLLLSNMVPIVATVMPTAMPMKARPPMPGLQPLPF